MLAAEAEVLQARVAGSLLARGLRAGDRVAYLCPNTAELLVAHFAVPASGEFAKTMGDLVAEPPKLDIYDAEPLAL